MLWRANEWQPDNVRKLPCSGLAVIIPALNAAATIAQVVRRVQQSAPGAWVVVVDDGSTDDTSIVAQSAGAEVIRQNLNLGKGAALQAGFDFVLRSSYRSLIATLDSDLQHRPEDLLMFMETMSRTGADIIVGKRERWGSGMPIERMLSNVITSALVRARTGLPIEDSQCGYRMMRRHVLETIRLTSAGYEAETEFLIRAGQAHYRVASAPIRTIYGSERSYMTHWTTTQRFVGVLFKEF